MEENKIYSIIRNVRKKAKWSKTREWYNVGFEITIKF